MNLVYIGTFTALLLLTSKSIDEATFYKTLLKDYQWTLRVASRAATFMDFAVRRLDTSLLHLDPLPLEDLVQDKPGHSEDRAGPQDEHPSSPQQEEMSPTYQQDPTLEQQRFLEILEAAELYHPHSFSEQILSGEMGPEPGLDFFGRDWNESVSPGTFQALDLSPS
jgi:hypothetical protein